jgi:hypothetical protein
MMAEKMQLPALSDLTPSLYQALSSRRRRRVEKQYSRVLSDRLWGLTREELKAGAQRAYSNAALEHIFTGHLCGVPGAILVGGYVEDIPLLKHWALLVLGITLLTYGVGQLVVGMRQAMQVGPYFRSRYDVESARALGPEAVSFNEHE